MAGRILTTWLLTYAVHATLFTAMAALIERTRWGTAAPRRDAFWKLALVGGVVTSTLFVAAGSAPSGAAIRVPARAVFASQAEPGAGIPWLAMTWIGVTAALALRTVRGWRAGVGRAGRRRVIRRGEARAALDAILGPAAERVDLTCSRTLGVPVAFRREICVPVRALRELPHDELRALLAHEAAHVMRRDAAWLVIAAAVRALGWWQPLNLVAASRLRLAMELCCDERAAAEPRERLALARCLIKVAEWNVENHRPEFAAMASRGSALRRRLELLLDDAPRGQWRAAPWLAVTAVAVPAVCLAPAVTIAGLSRVPAAAVRLVRQAHASETAASRAVPAPRHANRRPAARASTTPPAATDRIAVPEIDRDQPPAAMPDWTPDRRGLETVGGPAGPSTPLRDAIANARISLEPASSRTRLDISGPERRGLSRIARYIGFDATRPKLDVPAPEQRGMNWIAQRKAFDTTPPK